MSKKAKNKRFSEQFSRARDVLKADRTGLSIGAEGFIGREVKEVLNDFFSLSGDVSTDISACDKGFLITITATAKSVKEFKIVG